MTYAPLPPAALQLACVFEQAIGHVTFQANLAAQMRRWRDVAPQWLPLPYADGRRWPPPRLNWTVRAGLMARAALRQSPPDALLFHTHVPALLCPDYLRRRPALLSMDATPLQNALLGIYVGGSQRHGALRRLTSRWVAAALHRAYRVIAWSEWVRRSLLADYGVPPQQVEVLPPGIDLSLWDPPDAEPARHTPPRLLFVGGDFQPKGGDLLLECFRRFWRGRAELHLVTRTPLAPEPGVVLHSGLTPNAPALVRLFHRCDLFVLPTRGDTFAQVLLEAMASGLPVVASAVGAIPEVVVHGETGLLVPAGDAEGLFAAVEALLQDPELRRQMGQAGRERVRERFNIARNGRRLVELLHQAREERP